MASKNVKLIITLGPATRTEDDLRKIKDKGVDFVRVNISHSSIDNGGSICPSRPDNSC